MANRKSWNWIHLPQGFYSATLIVLVANILIRALGFVRNLLMAHYYGASAAIDAFSAALTLPSLVAAGLGEALASAVVPVASQIQARSGKGETHRFFALFFQVALCIVIIAALVQISAARNIIELVAPGFSTPTAQQAIQDLRWLAIYTFGGGLLLCLAGVFRFEKQFLLPSLCELLALIVGIVLLVWGATLAFPQTLVMSWGGSVGLASLILSVAFIVRYRYRPVPALYSPEIGQVLRLSFASMFPALTHFIHMFIDRRVGSLLPEGSIAVLQFAYILVNVPLILAIYPAATAALPYLSDLVAAGNRSRLQEVAGRFGDFVLLVFIPVAVFVCFYAEELVNLVYERGAFDSEDRILTAAAVRSYAIMILPVASSTLLSRILFALKDAWPIIACVLLDISLKSALSLLLPPHLGVSGLALATSAGSVSSWILLCVVLNRKFDKTCAPKSWKIALVSILSTVLAIALARFSDYHEWGLSIVWKAIIFMFCLGGTYYMFLAAEIRRLLGKLWRV